MTINRVKEIAEASKTIVQRDMCTWVEVWYDCKTHSLYTAQELKRKKKSPSVYMVGQMIRPNTEADVEQMVRRWMSM